MGIVSKLKKGVEFFKGSKRRSKLGLGIFNEEREAWYHRNERAGYRKLDI